MENPELSPERLAILHAVKTCHKNNMSVTDAAKKIGISYSEAKWIYEALDKESGEHAPNGPTIRSD